MRLYVVLSPFCCLNFHLVLHGEMREISVGVHDKHTCAQHSTFYNLHGVLSEHLLYVCVHLFSLNHFKLVCDYATVKLSDFSLCLYEGAG